MGLKRTIKNLGKYFGQNFYVSFIMFLTNNDIFSVAIQKC